MKHGNKTIQYSIYDRSAGNPDFIGETTSLKRPSLEMLTETMSGAGFAGEIDLPTLGQLSAMEYEISFKNANEKAIKLFGQKAQHLEARWVTDVLDTATGKIGIRANKDIIKCIPKKIDLGSVEGNATNETSVTFEVTYFKHIQDGKALIEIDKLNNVFIINGVDYAKELREAL